MATLNQAKMPLTCEMSCVQKKPRKCPPQTTTAELYEGSLSSQPHFASDLYGHSNRLAGGHKTQRMALTRYGALNRLLTLNQAFSLWAVLSCRLPRREMVAFT
ncbi:uncharacterized protein TNCT_551941 [Trichonephila clavata]|uniref:Uncharacterized protein n=1 Tax=Trichonephila clavata TaxID=2740835 RepID=A0A8X6LJH3_TRICU|nr:uncharacterized protein TNCT_551941 [Trichonephila clavata]